VETWSFQENWKPSQFFFFIISFYQILVPVKGIAGSMTNIQRESLPVKRIFRILMHRMKLLTAGAKEITAFNEHIEFKNVSFAYGDATIFERHQY